ncbi:MAG: hypothetical protein JO072_09800 [Parafilimonas sp.]|nr:hypothetical protein [Parafilimonas sp.]
MKKNEQLEAIDEMLRELEDVKGSHVTLLNEISRFENGSSKTGDFLKKEIHVVHEQANDNFRLLNLLINELQLHRNSFASKYNLRIV